MILIIAEKPSLGRDIANAIPGQASEINKQYIQKGNYIITWAFGHMLSLKETDDYDIAYKKWSIAMLTIFLDHLELNL